MDIFLLVLGIVFLVLGVVGCLVPIIPGPPIAYLSLVILFFHSVDAFHPSASVMLWYAVIVIGITVLDYFLPIWGTKKFGGTNAGKRGSIIGLIVAFIFPVLGPLTILVGPFLGAIVGELITGQDQKTAIRSGIGSFLGFVGGVILKVGVVVFVAAKFIELAF
ncbi:MAG: hypothetical protein ACI9JN_001417 [Bacteroidia bacterium]|jgi:uncharacterized protein YqgC (DUF456 family)